MREVRDILFASDFSAESDRAFEHARFLAERFRASLTLILVPTDLSAASRRAFSLAGLLARALEAKVLVLHVCPPSMRAGLVNVPGPAPAAAPAEEQVRRFVRPELEGVEVTAQVYVTGAPWDRIVKVAEEERGDLVVMATQGHDSIRDGIIGSNTDRVLRHAPCPVLVA